MGGEVDHVGDRARLRAAVSAVGEIQRAGQPCPHPDSDGAGTTPYIELAVDGGAVVHHRLGPDPEGDGDLLVRSARGELVEDLELAGREGSVRIVGPVPFGWPTSTVSPLR